MLFTSSYPPLRTIPRHLSQAVGTMYPSPIDPVSFARWREIWDPSFTPRSTHWSNKGCTERGHLPELQMMSIEIELKSWNAWETKTWKSDTKKFKKKISQDLTESKKRTQTQILEKTHAKWTRHGWKNMKNRRRSVSCLPCSFITLRLCARKNVEQPCGISIKQSLSQNSLNSTGSSRCWMHRMWMNVLYRGILALYCGHTKSFLCCISYIVGHCWFVKSRPSN